MAPPRTHYQISLTARQAVGLFAALLLALGGAYFFGLMTGLSGRDAKAPEEAANVEAGATSTPPPAEVVSQPEAAAVSPFGSGPSRTSLSGSSTTPIAAEPTAPATVQTFEDGVAEEASPAAGTAPAPRATPARAAPGAHPPAPASGRVWVQAASLQSRDEANALSARLSKHGFHAVVLAASGPKGKVYRVRVGPYRTDDEAARAVSKLSRQEKIREPWIVPDGK